MSAVPMNDDDTLRAEGLRVVLDVDGDGDGDGDAGRDGRSASGAITLRPVDGLSLTLRRGQTLALVGESGCGKSLTALALMRLLPEGGAVEAGSIRLGADAAAAPGSATELLDLSEAQMRRLRGARIGMVFQDPGSSLNPVLTLGAQLREVIEAHTPLRGAAARARAQAWLAR
ncbi:MAG: ATP-binding cassette domain-containing protein, partial [Leptothrix sp. (in: b-proteobacteria)]